MAVPRKGILGFLLVCAATLAAAEYAVITYAVLPMPSTRFDWIVATGFFAPFVAAFLLWLIAAIVRIVADVLAHLRRAERWIKKTLSSLPQDQTPSSSTPSAARPSSSYGWPSDGSSYTSHRGKEEQQPWTATNSNRGSANSSPDAP